MRSIRPLILLLSVCSYAPIAFSQNAQPLNGLTEKKAAQLAQEYINEVTAKSEKTTRELNDQTEKYLDLLAKSENKLRRHLERVNPQAANTIFANSSAKY